MNTLVLIAGTAFLVWVVLGVVLKTRTPFREVLYRTGARSRPKPPPAEYDRFDLEV